MRLFTGLCAAWAWLCVALLGADVTVEVLDSSGKVASTTTIQFPSGQETVRVRFRDAAGATTQETLIPIPAPPPDSGIPAPGELPEFLETHHDRIRVQGRQHTDHVVRKGAWSDPNTWADGTVPTDADRVLIQKGAYVTLDVCGDADTLIVEGTLNVLENATTCLNVTTITILPGGELIIGTDDIPLTGKFDITFRDKPIDVAKDPGEYSHGLLVFGTLNAVGVKRTPHLRLASDLAAGDTNVALAAPVFGWAVGDELLFPDTRQLTSQERPIGYTQIERHTIASVATDRRSVTLKAPLAFAHQAAGDVLPHVANVTRSIVLESPPGAKVPAHTIYFDRASVLLKHVAFKGLGRTTNEAQGPGNVLARYAVHFHHTIGPKVMGVSTGPQFTLYGCVVDQGDAPHNRKWGVGFHGPVMGWCAGNVVYNTMGAGIITEDGSEQVIIEDNFVLRVGGIGRRMDDSSGGLGRQGTGLYLKGGFNRARRNVVANVWTLNPYSYAYGSNLFRLGKIMLPKGPGMDPMMPGDGVEVDGNAAGLGEFTDNEAFSNNGGLTYWWIGSENQTPIPDAKPSVILRFTSVNHCDYGIFHYQAHRLTIDGYKTRGTGASIGWYGADYLASDFVMIRADIQGQKTGISPSTVNGGGSQTFEDCDIAALTGIKLSVPWTNASQASGIGPRAVTIKNCRFRGLTPGGPFTAIERLFPKLGGATVNIVIADTVDVVDFQGVKDDNFRVFYDPQQAPGFVVPVTIPNPVYPGIKVIGAPEPGLTNAALWAKHKLAIAGEVAPATAKARSGIVGLVAP